MKSLASFVMRGPSQAALVSTATALLSLLVPFLGLLSAGVVGLVTLRRGARDGLVLLGLGAVATAAISWLALGSPWAAVGVLVVVWLPVWGLSAILRATRALGFTLQLAGLGGLVVVLVLHGALGDPAAYWQQLLEPVRQSLVSDGLIAAEPSEALFQQLATWMTGAFAAALVLQYLLSLFIARAWQAQLYNPGGFGVEFRGLTLSRALGLAFLLAVVWAVLAKGSGLPRDLMPVLALLLILQGLAVAHRLREITGGHQGWMVGLYVLMVLFMPQVGLLLASVGLVDLWTDIRGRVAERVSGRR